METKVNYKLFKVIQIQHLLKLNASAVQSALNDNAFKYNTC